MKNFSELFLADRSILRQICVLTVFLLLPVLSANAETTKINESSKAVLYNRISGFVYDQNRNPVAQLYVELQDELNRSLSVTRTDSTGRYEFGGMSDGVFYVRIVSTGTDFQEQSERVRVINFGQPGSGYGRSDNVTQDFYLSRRKNSSDIANSQTGVVFAQDIPEQAQVVYKKAVAHFEKKNYDEAIKFLKETLELFPNHFTALNRLGFIYYEQKEYDSASQYFARAADVNPRSEATIYFLAESVFLTGRYDTTVDILRGALGQEHKTYRIYLLFGKTFRAKKDFDKAEKSLKFAEKANNEKDSEVYWQLAQLYANNLKKYGMAAKQLELYLKFQPNSDNKENIKKLIKKFKQMEKEK